MTLPGDVIVGDAYSTNLDIRVLEPTFLGITTVNSQTGGGSSQYLVYNQDTALATWTINHTFPRFPSVTVIDTSGFVIITDIEYPTNSMVVLTFAQPTSGKALLV